MNNTIKEIETKIATPFGDLRKRSIYTATPIQVSGGIYFTDREKVKNDLVVEELFMLYIQGQTYGEIIIDGTKVDYDILFEFKDSEAKEIFPQEMNIALLYNIIYNEVMGLQNTEFCTYEVKIEYFLDDRAISETKEADDYVTGLGDCKMKKANACAYCSLHNCYLSAKQMKKRDCVNRNCKHFQKEEHPFWDNQGLNFLNNKGDKNNEQ